MKIEIIAAGNPAFCPTVLADGKKIAAPKHSISDPWGWSDEELILLLGSVNFTDLQNGHYKFNVSTSHFKLVTGQRPCKDTHEVKLLTDFGIL